MGNAKMITRETEIHAFQAGIFMSDADVFSPVAIYPNRADSQTLQDFFDEQQTHPSQWMSYAGPAGIGQYSLRRRKPAGVLARFDIHFRYPTDDEMQTDFQHFGEQVLGPTVKEVPKDEREKYKGNGVFRLWGKDHYFTGPPRLIKSVFLSRVFPADIPADVSDLVREVDEVAETGDMITSQGYQFLHSIDGKIMYLPFGKIEDFDTSKMKMFGTMEMDGKRLVYLPNGDRSHPIDFSQAMHD
ncbi:hypothetical protein HYZ97_03095 [Candidatus Pacearchaeota archaeon]|nr:hypothetical protein [Candidatus Pacearchaeota archaeon]